MSSGQGWIANEAPRSLRDAYVRACKNRKKFHASSISSAPGGIPECRRQIAAMERDLFGTDISEKNVVVGMGSTQMTRDIFVTLADPGESVILFDPCDSNYARQIDCTLPGSRIVRLKVLDDASWLYLPDVDKTIEEFHELFGKHRPKIIVMAAPDLVTGQNPDERLVKEIVDTAARSGSFVVMDMASKTRYFGDEPPSYFQWSPSEYANLVCLRSNSNLTHSPGRRLGWIIASPMVVEGMERTQEVTIHSPDVLHQTAFVDYIQQGLKDGTLREYLEKTRSDYEETARFTVRSIDRHLGLRRLIPQGGSRVVVDVEQDANEFVPRLLEKTGVLFGSCSEYGPSLRNGIRISYAPHVKNHGHIERALEKVGVALDRELA